MFALTSHRIGWRWPCWRPLAEMHCSDFKVILYFILEVSVQAVLIHVKQLAPATIYCGKPWSNILWEHLPSYCIITWNNLEPAIVLTSVSMSQSLLELGEAQKKIFSLHCFRQLTKRSEGAASFCHFACFFDLPCVPNRITHYNLHTCPFTFLRNGLSFSPWTKLEIS